MQKVGKAVVVFSEKSVRQRCNIMTINMNKTSLLTTAHTSFFLLDTY